MWHTLLAVCQAGHSVLNGQLLTEGLLKPNLLLNRATHKMFSRWPLDAASRPCHLTTGCSQRGPLESCPFRNPAGMKFTGSPASLAFSFACINLDNRADINCGEQLGQAGREGGRQHCSVLVTQGQVLLQGIQSQKLPTLFLGTLELHLQVRPFLNGPIMYCSSADCL
jgi:hypothetical protein